MNIIDTIGTAAVLEQLAEESAELAHAALKLARKMRGVNPTPKTEEECWEALIEEMADVQVCEEQLQLGIGPQKIIKDTTREKTQRWEARIKQGELKNHANDD